MLRKARKGSSLAMYPLVGFPYRCTLWSVLLNYVPFRRHRGFCCHLAVLGGLGLDSGLLGFLGWILASWCFLSRARFWLRGNSGAGFWHPGASWARLWLPGTSGAGFWPRRGALLPAAFRCALHVLRRPRIAAPLQAAPTSTTKETSLFNST